jgi:N-acetylglucosaminyldiphosphoundecaprenol N-acetyl-beta-D-mannosaminyltransferase
MMHGNAEVERERRLDEHAKEGGGERDRDRDLVRVAGLPFDRVTMAGARARIIAMARRRDRPRQVCTGNLDHLYRAQRDAAFRAAYESADLVLPDGASVVWLSRLTASTPAGARPLPARVAGSDLFWELARASSEQHLRLFFLGGAPGSAARAAIAAERRFPGTCIVGTYCPPRAAFDTAEEQRRIEGIVRAARPDVLLVGLGAPKQEIWIAEHKHALGVPVAIGVGGSFEMAAGVHKRAPVALQRAGLEWLYRFAQEPVRLFERYFVHDLPTFVRLAAAALRARMLPPSRPLG